jgi:hypothetical protein
MGNVRVMNPVNDPNNGPFSTPLPPNQIILSEQEATLLNLENQPLAIGEAILYIPIRTGEFFPTRNLTVSEDSLPQQAATLKKSDGRLYTLKPDKILCQAMNKPSHFHFCYEPLP